MLRTLSRGAGAVVVVGPAISVVSVMRLRASSANLVMPGLRPGTHDFVVPRRPDVHNREM
jgi:hypothetical protein